MWLTVFDSHECVQFVFTVISVGLPIGAGIFGPNFVLGAGVGRLVGEIMHSLFPEVDIVPGGYAVVGMLDRYVQM